MKQSFETLSSENLAKLALSKNYVQDAAAYSTEEYLDARKKAMKKFIGDNKKYIDNGSKYSENFEKNLDSFIFMKESEIYLEFVTMLRKKGLRVVQIYDGFYLEKGAISEKELQEILKNITLNASIDK